MINEKPFFFGDTDKNTKHIAEFKMKRNQNILQFYKVEFSELVSKIFVKIIEFFIIFLFLSWKRPKIQ
jgi:hypothetical protein